MPQPPAWKRVLATSMRFTQIRHSRQLASNLVVQGQLARDQLGAIVDELVEMSRRRSEELRRILRSEADRQLNSIGLATKTDLAAFESRLRTAQVKKTPAKQKAAATYNAVRKPAAASTAKPAR